MKRRILSILLAASLSASLLAGCGSAGQDSKDSAKQENGGAESSVEGKTDGEKMPLRILGFNSVIGHIDSVIAYTGGYYEEEGIEPEFTYNNSNPDNAQALLEDKEIWFLQEPPAFYSTLTRVPTL